MATSTWVASTLATMLTIAMPASAQRQPTFDVSGTWQRESVTGSTGGGSGAAWGPKFTAIVDGTRLTVIPSSGPRRLQYTLDSLDVVESWHAHCPAYSGSATNAAWNGTSIIIRESLTRGSCVNAHGTSKLTLLPPGGREAVLGPRADLQSEMRVAPLGDGRLSVEVMALGSDGTPATVTAFYRKQ